MKRYPFTEVRIFIFAAFLIMSGCGVSQHQYSSGSGRAVKYYESARESFREQDPEKAEKWLVRAIQKDDSFIEAYQALSQIYLDQGKVSEAVDLYCRSLEIDPEANPDGYRMIAGLAVDQGMYERADTLIDRFLSFSPEQVTNYDRGILIKKKCEFALHALRHPVPFQPENMGDSINSELNEYWPSLSVDGQILYFTVLLDDPPERIHEDFFYATFEGDHWSARKNLGPPINTPDNEGAQSITADGRTLYFTACNRPDGMGKCDIYVSEYVEGAWSVPVNLGYPVNTASSDKHPSISPDGRRLYFCSDRVGGKGGFDIWFSDKKGASWSKPVNAGDSVNTPGMEQSPFIHPDQQTLYFSSDGWPGMGNGDLFMSSLKDSEGWKQPENLGYPVNTHNDEVGLIINAAGDRAYFASNRHSGADTDLYTFPVPEKIRPVHVSYLKGRVYDAGNFRGLEAVIQLIDLSTEAVVMELRSSPGEGDFLVSLPANRDYALNVSREGYMFYSDHFAFSGEHTGLDPLQKNIPLQPLKIGSSVILNNIFFDHDSYQLKEASGAELNKVFEFMTGSPGIRVQIAGHTDNTGEYMYNLELSEKRAGAVVDYLVKKGISPGRFETRGYGPDRPVSDNITEEGRRMNRRTELTVIEN
ncbi:MAG: PD40 domain-containing protein [Bacteroidales bacterium]|nr:PD40 domain-containing protein [Bacteroidales bacterium]